MSNPVGRPARIPGAIKVSFWISRNADEMLDQGAAQNGQTRSEIVSHLIENWYYDQGIIPSGIVLTRRNESFGKRSE